METVQAIIDKRNPGSSICESDLFFYVVESKDMELLSLLAMRVKTYSEWNLRKKELEPLLELPGFDEVRSHYAVLKQADDEAKREAAKEKRKETEMKNHKEFLQNPREKLEKAAGKTKENKLWKEWYEYQYNTEPQRIIGMVLHDLKDLDWAGHFPAEYLADTVVKSSGNYVGENDYSKKSAGKDIRLLLKTLYEKREDMREAILALNGILYYEGREAFKVNFGDSHEDWFVDFDPLPAYKLSVYMSGSELQVQLDETKAGSVQA
ncbi:MAG: hypothetical protein CW338_08955 [Clostridiales bacterium]|nr:hypothetical protein [Clostridiales bacterium]